MLKWVLFSTMLMHTCGAAAIDVGDMVFSLRTDKDFVAKHIFNNSKTINAYYVEVIKVNSPKSDEPSKALDDGEVMYTPRRLVLEPGESDSIKLFYKGKSDHLERYYRVIFREVPVFASGQKPNKQDVIVEPIVALDTVFVIRPRNESFSYHIDANRTLTNDGNVAFKVIIKNDCSVEDSQANSFYLMPGKKVGFPILKATDVILIVAEKRFIPVGKSCN